MLSPRACPQIAVVSVRQGSEGPGASQAAEKLLEVERSSNPEGYKRPRSDPRSKSDEFLSPIVGAFTPPIEFFRSL
jgi:hypothetical protein